MEHPLFSWTDMWNDECLQHKLPHLLSYAKNPHISVCEFLQTPNMQDHFFLPLSQQAYHEYQCLEQTLSDGM